MQTFGFGSSYQPGRDKISKTSISEDKVWLEQLYAECKLVRLNFRQLRLGNESDGERRISLGTHLHLVQGCFRPCMDGALRKYMNTKHTVRGTSATNTYPRTIAIDHIMMALQFVVMLGKVVVCLCGSKVAIMAHGIAKVKDFGDEVWRCTCPMDKSLTLNCRDANCLPLALFASAHCPASSDVALMRVSSLTSIRFETAKYNGSMRSIFLSRQA